MEKNNKPIGQYESRKDCRFCQGKKLSKILDFGLVPLAGGFLKAEAFKEEKYYPLELNFCGDCGLVQVSNVVAADVLFKNYFYFSSSIKTLVDHLALFAKEVTERFLYGRTRPSVFEIGCNDGVLLKPFAALGVKAVGVDPATNVVNSIASKEITVINDFFSEQCALKVKKEHGSFDAVVSSYSFAHIDDMESIAKGIKMLLADDGVFVFEIHYLGTLIDGMQYDMIYHEHLSYYSLKVLEVFLEKFGMEIFDVKFIPAVRSGAARFYAQHKGKGKQKITPAVRALRESERQKGFDRLEVLLDYAGRVNKTREQLMALLNDLKTKYKTVIGYGASGRGTTIMNYCGIDRAFLDYVVDDAPAKHELYTPGTHIPIQPWEFTGQGKVPDYALLFAWSFIDEVVKKRQDYLNKGGAFIVPLPLVRVVKS